MRDNVYTCDMQTCTLKTCNLPTCNLPTCDMPTWNLQPVTCQLIIYRLANAFAMRINRSCLFKDASLGIINDYEEQNCCSTLGNRLNPYQLQPNQTSGDLPGNLDSPPDRHAHTVSLAYA